MAVDNCAAVAVLPTSPQVGTTGALTYYLVKKPYAFHALVDVLGVELSEVGDAGEQDAHLVTGLGVQLL